MILWFSGTGNSREVAELLAIRLHEKIRELKPDVLSGHISVENEKRIIWVFPVYSWGVPPYIRTVISSITLKGIPDSAVHHLVVTCGDDTGLTAEMWRKDIRRRRWLCGSSFSVQMPNNYVCMKGFDVDPIQLEREKLQSAPARVDEIVSSIIRCETTNNHVNDMVKGRFAWIKSKVIYPWFIRYAMSPKPFRYTASCISCGKCASICPMDNITMAQASSDTIGQSTRPRRHPEWGGKCAGCLACYHVCPKHAVEYGNSTINKGQYLNPIIRRT